MYTSKPQPIQSLYILVVSFLSRRSEKSCAPQESWLILGNNVNGTKMFPVLFIRHLHGIELHSERPVREGILVQMWVIMRVQKKAISVHFKESSIQLSNIPRSLCSSCFLVSYFSPKKCIVNMTCHLSRSSAFRCGPQHTGGTLSC